MGLGPRPCCICASLQGSPEPHLYLKGPTSKGNGDETRKRREEKGLRDVKEKEEK